MPQKGPHTAPVSRNNTPSKKPSIPRTLEGTFTIGKNGKGYVKNKEFDVVVEIPAHLTNNALHRDGVRVEITDTRNQIGKVIDILKRSKVGYAGTLIEKAGTFILVPTDARDPEIEIQDKKNGQKNNGKKIFATITSFDENGKAKGVITQVLGSPGENDAEMLGIALEKGFDEVFPEAAIKEAEKLAEHGISEDEIKNRRDMRRVPTFTIDPEDAKDFDDAISIQHLPDGKLEIGIHIADVSHYVRPGSALDQEAQERTTSVYLVDRVLPMLPEGISNDLCSLRPNEDKFTYSAIFEMTSDGTVTSEWFGRTIINSDKRFSYEEAQEVIDTGNGPFAKELILLNDIAKNYTEERFRNGAMSLDSDEVKFVLDEEGTPIKVTVKKRIDTNRLIEEFMLLANKHVATFMSKKSKRSLFVYRIHDKPDMDRMQDLRTFLKGLGYKVKIKNGVIPPEELNALIREVSNSDLKSTIQSAVVRSMAKAIYSTENIGHYGLGFHYYTHFTSPIRRYPDVMVHRLTEKALRGQEITPDEAREYERMTIRSSERERDAQEAEWASVKYKQVEYMKERIGEIYEGVVTGVTKRGIFIAERETRAEGLVFIEDIPGDMYSYNAEQNMIIGSKTKKKFKIGDSVTVKVTAADLKNRLIDYKLVEKK